MHHCCLPLLVLLVHGTQATDFERLIAQAHSDAQRNKDARVASYSWDPSINRPSWPNTVANPWPTSYVYGGLTPTLAVLFRKGNATEVSAADQFYLEALPTWINSTFSQPISSKVNCKQLGPDGYPPLGCYGSGCPLEHTLLSRAFAMHSSASPFVKSGAVTGFSNATEQAMQLFYFRYLQNWRLFYPHELDEVHQMYDSGNIDTVRKTAAFLAAETLAQDPKYAALKLSPDGPTVAQAAQRWGGFMAEWLAWRATSGLFVELGAAYWPRTWPGFFNLHDLARDPRVRARAKAFLDIAMVEEEQTSARGVRAGQRSRAKRDPAGSNRSMVGDQDGLSFCMLYQIGTPLYGDYPERAGCPNPGGTLHPGMHRPYCSFNRVIQAEAGFYQASNVSVLMHKLGVPGSFISRNRLIGSMTASDAPDGVSPGSRLDYPSKQIHWQSHSEAYNIAGVVFDPNINVIANSQQRWTGMVFTNQFHTTFGLDHLTGEKWSAVSDGVMIAQKCAPHCSRYDGWPLVELYNTTSITLLGEWAVAVASDDAGKEWGYGAVRAVWGGSRFINLTTSADVHVQGQLKLNDQWSPLMMVGGSASAFGSLANFSTFLHQADSQLQVSSDRKTLQAVWGDAHIEFFPNDQAGKYVLPKVNGETVDVDPKDFSYDGPHLKTNSSMPTSVETRYQNYVIAYDFTD